MDRKALLLCFTAGLLGLLFSVTIFAVEATRTKDPIVAGIEEKISTWTFLPKVRPISIPAETVDGFGKMISETERKYYMLGGKGGVGKTSCSASLAVKFANHGHPTIVVSADPAHSLSASFDQDLRGGILVPVQGMPSSLFAIEINPERTKEDYRSAIQKDGGAGVKSFIDSMGLGMFSQQVRSVEVKEAL